MFEVAPSALDAILGLLRDRNLAPSSLGLRIHLDVDPKVTEAGACFEFLPEAPAGAQELCFRELRVWLAPEVAERLSGVRLEYLDDLTNRGFVFQGLSTSGCSTGCGSGSSAIEV